MAYETAQQKTSSWSPAFHHEKSESLFKPRPFSVQPETDTDESEEQEIPAYTRFDRDAISANLLSTMSANVQTQAEVEGQKSESESQEEDSEEISNETQTLQRTSESGESGDEDDNNNSPNKGAIQRQEESSSSQDEEEVSSQPEVVQPKEEPSQPQDDEVQPVQTKLTLGAPGDKYEQEADSVAAQVMSMSVPPTNAGLIQRQGKEEEQEPLVQRTPLADSITPLVQRQTEEQEEPIQTKSLLQRTVVNGNAKTGGNLESQLSSSKGGGNPLPNEVRSFMEPRFGADFSQVRVHTDSTAIQMNKELSAQAFAHGSDIYYGAGKSPGNNELTAHELTHTIQQTGGLQLNKEVRRQPKPEEQEKEQLQAKELGDRIPEVSPNKELRLQPIEEQQEAEPLQAKQLGDRTPEVSSNKELRLQPIEEQEEAEPLQAKQLGDRTSEASPNKELRLQPIEEQQEAEPLQAKELPSHNPELSLNKELQRQPLGTANLVIQAKSLEGDFTPSPLSIQRGIGDWLNKGKDLASGAWNKGKDLLNSGLDWVKNNIIQPLTNLASSGWSAVKNFGSQISTAFTQANPTIWDVFQPEHLMFRMARNQRQQLYAQAIQAEQNQRARAASGIQSSGPAPVQEPSQLERLNGLAETIESGAETVFGVGKEIVEGAVLGDFKENPSIWNTIGQVAIGFVPYAGQVADIRDIVANVKKLHETGYKDPDAWINLGLTAIGIIPGVGDAIKAVGKGAKGAIRKALSGVLKNADKILRPVLGKAKGLLNGAGRYGKQFLGWASGQGAKLLQGVKGFAQKTANFAKAASQRARGLVTALQSRIGGFVNSAMQKASAVVSQGRGLLGKAIAKFTGMAKQAFNAVQSRVSQGVNLVKAAAQRGKDVALKVGRKIAETTRKATNLLREFTQSAIQKGRQALQKARQWSSQQFKKATDLGRRLVTQARKRVASLIPKGLKSATQKALSWVKQKLGGVKQRIKNFLQDKWNRLKEKLGIKKPEQPTGKNGEPKGKPVPEDLKKLVSDEAQLQRLLSKTGDDAEQLKQLLSSVGNDATKLEKLLDELGAATLREIGTKGLKEISSHLTPTEIKDWVAKLGAKRVGQLAEKYGGDAMKHYGADWFQAYKGINLDTQRHVTAGDGHSKKSGISGCHDTDNFVTKYISPATDERIFIHSQSTSGAYTKYEYSMMKADGSGPKAQKYLKTTRKGLENNWISIAEDLTKQLDAAIKNKTFPINNGTKGSISYDGVTWEFWFRDDMIHSIYPII